MTTERQPSLATVLISLDRLTEAIHAASRRRRALVRIGSVIAILGFGMLGLQLQTSSHNRETLTIVRSAVDPNGEVSKRGQEATLAALNSINCTTLYLHDIHPIECDDIAKVIDQQRMMP